MNDVEYISDEEAGRRYEADPDFLAEALDTACTVEDLADLPQVLRDALVAWYRTTPTYEVCVLHVREDAERPE